MTQPAAPFLPVASSQSIQHPHRYSWDPGPDQVPSSKTGGASWPARNTRPASGWGGVRRPQATGLSCFRVWKEPPAAQPRGRLWEKVTEAVAKAKGQL